MLECEDVDTGDRSSLSGVESASKGVCGVEVPEPPLDERRLNINSKKAWSADRHHHRPRCVHMRQKPKTRKRNKEEQGRDDSLHEIVQLRNSLEDNTVVPRRMFGKLPEELDSVLELVS